MFMFLFTSVSYIIYGQEIDIKAVEEIFEEYEDICQYDNGNLWGISLHGPLMFVERASRTIIANTADKNGGFMRINGVYQGKLPENQSIANTTFNWKGTQWTMVMLPFNSDYNLRNQLIFHESFHSIQIKLGIKLPNAENPHLDLKDGRTYLQLEWLALLRAHESISKLEYIRDALIFRKYRRGLYPKSDSTENILELLEGIPEYTGIKLSGRDSIETIRYFSEMVKEARNRPSFFRTFPYTSGPLYCFLLDGIEPLWRKNILEINDLGEHLRKAYSISLPADLKTAAHIAAIKYDGDEIIKQERIIEEQFLAKKQSIINTFIEGPVLILRPKKPNMEFSPINMMAVDDMGTYYKTFRLVDIWGVLESDDGVFILKDWSAVHISARDMVVEDSVLSGKGWVLKLKEGWIISQFKDSSDFVLTDHN